MFLGILTLLTALTISAVAIYYSVAGLVAIFAAATVPIIIMGSALEIGKLVTALWLHKYWNQAVWWLKTYLSIAVVVLMFITSMGIFGFLSKAHIDQTAGARENIARIEQIDQVIAGEQAALTSAEAKVVSLETQGTSQDDQLQQQIDREQIRVDGAYARVQPAIDEQNAIIQRIETETSNRAKDTQSQITAINDRLLALDAALAENNVRLVQSIIGIRQDGSLGPGTERAIRDFRQQQEEQIAQLTERADSILNASNPAADAARAEIQRLRQLAETEIADSNTLISRLRSQIGSVDTTAQVAEIAKQRQFISETQEKIQTLTQEKFDLETEYRRLEAEVGPIKYLAEFVYGNTADKDMLEEAVRWVIVIIIFVFDPLAVLLLIASQYTFAFNKVTSKESEVFRIVLSDQEKDKPDELLDRVVDKRAGNNDSAAPAASDQTKVASSEHGVSENDSNQSRATDNGRDMEVRQRELEELEEVLEWKDAKHQWKIDNPNNTIKEFKEAYVRGDINNLPWESYVKPAYRQNEEQQSSSIWSRIRRDRFND